MSSEAFDPYHKWLGIPPKDQPANHYRLLGVSLFESDQDVIVNAADRQMAHIRSLAAGKHSDLSQKILNEISRAKLILLSKEKREQYDAALRQLDLGGEGGSIAPPAPPMGSSVGRARAVAPPSPSGVGRGAAAPSPSTVGRGAAVAPVAVAPAQGSAARKAGPAPQPVQQVQVAPSIEIDEERSVSQSRRRPAAAWYASPGLWVAVGLVAVGGAGAFFFMGDAGADHPVAQGNGKHGEGKHGEGKSGTPKPGKTGTAKTDEASSAKSAGTSGETGGPAAATTGESSAPAFGAPKTNVETASNGGTSGDGSSEAGSSGGVKRPRTSGGSWPTLPIDKSAIRSPQEMAALQGMREKVQLLERSQDWPGVVALLQDQDELLLKDHDLLRARAGGFANLGALEKAERDLAKRLELHTEPNAYMVHELVTVQLAEGKKDDARKTILDAFDRYEKLDQPMFTIRLAYMTVPMSHPGVPWSRVEAAARRAVAAIETEANGSPNRWFVTRGLAAVLARKAAAEKDSKLAKEAIQTFSPTARQGWDLAFIALCQTILGDSAASVENLRAAGDWNQSYLPSRNWQTRLEAGNLARDLKESYGLNLDAGGASPGLAFNGAPRVGGPGTPEMGGPGAFGGPGGTGRPPGAVNPGVRNSNDPFGPGGASGGPPGGARMGSLPTDGTWTPESNGAAGERRPGGLASIPKKPAPTGDALKTAAGSIRELFKKEFDEAKKPDAKLELSRRIAGQARQLANDPNAQFAAFVEAKDLAMSVGDTALAWDLVEETSGLFEVDAPALQMEVLAKDNTLVKTPVHAKLWCERAEKVLAAAVAGDEYELASRLARMGVATSKKSQDPILLKAFSDSSTEIEAIKKAFTAMEASLKTLESTPDDAAANGVVGKFYALQKRDWTRGLKHLAKGDDAALKAAAEKELARPASPTDQAAVGDLWYRAAEERPLKDKKALQGRAIQWYKTAEPGLDGLAKATVSKRLEDYQAPLWDRIRAALKGRKFAPSVGAGTTQIGTGQFEIPADPRILVGVEFNAYNYSSTLRGNYSLISRVSPIYLSPSGKTRGADGGEFGATVVEAKPGYAVGSIAVNYSSEYIHGLSVTFVSIEGGVLNPRDSYTTSWYGSKTGGMTVQLGTNTAPIISLGTQSTSSYLRGIQGLLAQ